MGGGPTHRMQILDAEEIMLAIRQLADRACGECRGHWELHRALQSGILALAGTWGLHGILEYRTTRSDGRTGFIDVVWLDGRVPVAAFEIDAALRKKSIDKLLHLPVASRFWVYFGGKPADWFIRGQDPQGLCRWLWVQTAQYQPPNSNEGD